MHTSTLQNMLYPIFGYIGVLIRAHKNGLWIFLKFNVQICFYHHSRVCISCVNFPNPALHPLAGLSCFLCFLFKSSSISKLLQPFREHNITYTLVTDWIFNHNMDLLAKNTATKFCVKVFRLSTFCVLCFLFKFSSISKLLQPFREHNITYTLVTNRNFNHTMDLSAKNTATKFCVKVFCLSAFLFYVSCSSSHPSQSFHGLSGSIISPTLMLLTVF